jgi:hypothetical protein
VWCDRIRFAQSLCTASVKTATQDIGTGYAARALTASIFAEGDSLMQLRDAVRDAVRCHFEDAERPSIIRLLFTRDEVIEA